jgi:hypothetical protein
MFEKSSPQTPLQTSPRNGEALKPPFPCREGARRDAPLEHLRGAGGLGLEVLMVIRILFKQPLKATSAGYQVLHG